MTALRILAVLLALYAPRIVAGWLVSGRGDQPRDARGDGK